MIDVKETIKDTENFCKHLGWTPKPIEKAIKIMKMWEWFKYSFGDYIVHYGCLGDRPLNQLVKEAEDRKFPPMMTKTITVEIQGRDELKLHNVISNVRSVLGVKEVRPYDTDC